MGDDAVERARWPVRLRELCQELPVQSTQPGRGQVIQEIWIILAQVLQRSIEAQRSMCSGLTVEDVEDLTSEKALDLVQRLETGKWWIGERTASEVAGFLATVARNAVLDLVRRHHRKGHVAEATIETSADCLVEETLDGEMPDAALEREEFIDALRSCATLLQPRVRRIWFLRVFYSMATKQIASHPEVQIKPARVDELLFEARQTIRRCMESKGQKLRQLPTGTFFAIWTSFAYRDAHGEPAREPAFDTSI